jgi:hypothetical protein
MSTPATCTPSHQHHVHIVSSAQALSLEEARERQARLAKMRNLMFYAEVKAKRLAKIKSKEYRRHANKAAKRAAAKAAAQGGGGDADAEKAAREAAEEAEFERAKERLTLKHKNTSKWARRALKRGVQVGACCGWDGGLCIESCCERQEQLCRWLQIAVGGCPRQGISTCCSTANRQCHVHLAVCPRLQRQEGGMLLTFLQDQ